jgi:hypothetical protein
MTAALTPAQAVDYLTALSADLRAAVVLDAAGERLAGPPGLARPARALLEGRAPSTRRTGRTERGVVLAARDDRHAIVVLAGPLALERVAFLDIATALSALGGQSGLTTRPEGIEAAALAPLLDAL